MSTTRIQLALNVENIGEATAFYEQLFGVSPHKQRDGYANFVVEDPPLKLVLIENPGAGERLNHLGIEAPTPEQVTAALARFQSVGLTTRVAEQDVCCHAVHDLAGLTRHRACRARRGRPVAAPETGAPDPAGSGRQGRSAPRSP